MNRDMRKWRKVGEGIPVSGTSVICDDERNGKKKPAINTAQQKYFKILVLYIHTYMFQEDRRRKGRKHGGGVWFVRVFFLVCLLVSWYWFNIFLLGFFEFICGHNNNLWFGESHKLHVWTLKLSALLALPFSLTLIPSCLFVYLVKSWPIRWSRKFKSCV